MNSNLASILRDAQLLSATQQQAVEHKTTISDTSVSDAVVQLGYASPTELTNQLAELFGLKVADPNEHDYPTLCKQLGLRELISRFQALPLYQHHHTLFIAVSDPSQSELEQEFGFATNLGIELLVCEEQLLKASIRRLYGNSLEGQQIHKEISEDDLIELVNASDSEELHSEDLSQDHSPVSRFIHQILLEAVRKGASDIHFEPYEESYRIRLRCDGILLQAGRPPAQLSRRLAARLKILAKLDIAERRLPQDGRIKLRLNSETAIDLRVSTLPTLWGEKVVLRLLDGNSTKLDIDKLGYSEAQKKLYLDALQRPQGMILMTGPTGSGKTISLYTGLSRLNTVERNISTAEDPVEINLPGINQVQIHPKIGFTFATALKSFLRQDPDVVMLGEIRDLETAQIAVKAAQTGHLVLSTLHTNSAAETIVRLSNMGVEAYNLASSLSLIIAQRLARRLCPCCKELDTMPSLTRQSLQVNDSAPIYRANPQGCNHCNAGYSGRIGIYEVMPFNDQLIAAIAEKKSIAELEAIATMHGMQPLREAGIDKLKQGITSYQELQRVLYL